MPHVPLVHAQLREQLRGTGRMVYGKKTPAGGCPARTAAAADTRTEYHIVLRGSSVAAMQLRGNKSCFFTLWALRAAGEHTHAAAACGVGAYVPAPAGAACGAGYVTLTGIEGCDTGGGKDMLPQERQAVLEGGANELVPAPAAPPAASGGASSSALPCSTTCRSCGNNSSPPPVHGLPPLRGYLLQCQVPHLQRGRSTYTYTNAACRCCIVSCQPVGSDAVCVWCKARKAPCSVVLCTRRKTHSCPGRHVQHVNGVQRRRCGM